MINGIQIDPSKRCWVIKPGLKKQGALDSGCIKKERAAVSDRPFMEFLGIL